MTIDEEHKEVIKKYISNDNNHINGTNFKTMLNKLIELDIQWEKETKEYNDNWSK